MLAHLFLVGQAVSVQLEEEPLSPFVVVRRTGGDLLQEGNHIRYSPHI